MSAPRRKDGVVSFDDLQRELDKSTKKEGAGPFRFQVSPDKVIEVQPHTLDQRQEIEKAYREGTSADFLKALCGDSYDEIMETFRDKDARLFDIFTVRMQQHFDLGEALA